MLIRFLLTALAVITGFSHPLHAQQDRWSTELVGLAYETGDEVNCPIGIGLGIDFERQLGSPFVAVIGGLRLADAPACTDVGTVRLVNGRWYNEAAHLSLIGAPLLGVAVGPDPATFPLPIRPRLRLALLAAKIDAPKDERHPMPLAQAELHARFRALAILVRTGTIRAPVLLQTDDSGQPETVAREWHWRRIFEAGVRLHW